MSLDKLFKQNKQNKNPAEMDNDGDSLPQTDDSIAVDDSPPRRTTPSNRTSKKKLSTRNSSDDESSLPEKKRARRRLIGAVALVLAAVIGLPMVFDSEPRSSAPKISIDIPSKDSALPASSVNVLSASASADKASSAIVVNPALDTPVAVVVPASSPKSPASSTAPVEKELTAKLVTPVPKDKLETDKADATKKPDNKIDPKAEQKKSDAARALAILEGRSADSTESKLDSKNKTTEKNNEKPAGSFSLQVAAISSPAIVRELQSKLKQANIQSYTQKVITKSGEVTRIRVGPFTNKADAEKIRKKLEKLELNGTLVSN